MRHPLRFFYNWWYRYRPPEMVQWWKESEAVVAKATTHTKTGSYEMQMGKEKYRFQGYPRGHLLYGTLSPLKHQIKNQVFNDSWAKLEEGVPTEEINDHIKNEVLGNILELGEKAKYDMYPVEKQVPAVREVHRAWSKCAKMHPREAEILKLRDIACYILNEDDGYRFRFQWIAEWVPFKRFAKPKHFDLALRMMEHAEVVDDMKERIRLLRRIVNLMIEDPGMGKLFRDFVKELDWNKVKLTKADKYYFRAKYFKVDYKRYDY